MTTSLLERFALLVNQDPLFRPRRIVTRSGVRVRGIFPSVRFNRTLHWESALERDLIYRLESSWLVSDACTQPTTVRVPSADGDFNYTPDALILTTQGRLCCIECKPSSKLSDLPLFLKLKAIRTHLRSLGIGFLVVTEDALDQETTRANAKRLVRALRDSETPAAILKLSNELSLRPATTYGQLVSYLGSRAANSVLAHGVLYFDVHRPICDSTQLFSSLKEECDAASFIYAK